MGNAADLQWATEGPVPPSSPAVSVDVTVLPVLSSALAHSAVPVVSRLTLTSRDTALRGATVRLSVQDAEGALGSATERLVDLDVGRPAVLDAPGLVLDPAAMRQVAGDRTGWVQVELEAQGHVLASRRVPVQVLAAGSWVAGPLPLALEVLAAHVQPDDPAVHALLAEAAALLEEGTGNGSMAGCADDAERIDEVVEAITWAMRRREVRATDLPAGWAATGHRVRTPGEVLDGRAGTSLDTVLTLAAACEQAGLRPLLWIADGHAFLGYWRAERGAGTAATTDVTALVDLVDAGAVRLVETTLLTDRGNTRADLHGPAYTRWLAGDRSGVLGVTDVHRARQDGVRPLPPLSRHDAAVPVAEHRPAAAEPAAVDPAPAAAQQWAAALLDPDRRARLLDCTAASGLPLTVPPDALATLADLVGNGTALTLLPGDRIPGLHVERGLGSARDLPSAQLTDLLTEHRSVHVDVPGSGFLPRLRQLAQRARTGVEEAGANDLHLALGSLVWQHEGRPVRSPLVLLPVVLTPTRDGGFRLTADESGAATPNRCLLAELRRLHGISVPGLVDDGADLATVLHAVRTALAGHPLRARVELTADLTVLPSAAARQQQDLHDHWADFAANPLVAQLVDDPDGPFVDPVPAPAAADLEALAARCPLPADAAQLQAVAEATAGRTFVLEGAPGTGKSQTIANLLTRAVADGKRVLFVAAKRAALDVVARRLDAVGMGPLALDLHDKGGRPAVVRAQVRTALEHAVDADEPGLAADAADLRTSSAGLARYAERLHAEGAVGLSAWSARAAVLAAGDEVAALPVTASFAAHADADMVTAVRRALALLPDIADLARPSAGHAWGFIDTIELDITAVQQAAVAVDTAIRELPGEGGLAAVLRAARTTDDLDTLAHLLSGPRVGLDVLDEVRMPRWAAATADVTAEVAALTGAVHAGFEVATPAALALPLAALAAQAQAAGAEGWWARRRALAALREQLAPVLKPGATLKTADVPALIDSLGRVQAAVHGLAARALTIPGLQVPAGWNPFLDSGRFVLDAEVRWLRRAAAAVDGTTGLAGALRRFLATGPVADAAAARTVAGLRDVVAVLLGACASTPAQLAAWSGTDGLLLRWTMTRPERGVEYVHPMSLRRWVSLLDTLEPLRLAGLTEARTRLRNGLVPADDAVRAFDRGLAEAALAERLAATGLDAFDAGLHERTLTRFATASRAVRSHLTAALPAAVLAARPTAGVADDLGALQQDLAGRGGELGVRGLLAAHAAAVTSVLPCVLAGPDSVARFLPATAGLFDLVVFDEASQLRVADAVGALGRARAAVVVGDSRQLPPAAGEPDGDEESLLAACLRAGVPRRTLSWHYRSQDESLIAFSNAAYYDDGLSSFPAPVQVPSSPAPGGRGVSLVPVGGTFVRSGPERDTNPVEAAAVVAEVRRRFAAAAPASPSIAVVTLHAPQRTLVETLLRDCGDERVAEALDRADADGLLVKHVADVQGDERDVVLLSTGASPDDAGRVPPVFGPLHRRAGERWLNVAITRARRQVVVVSSFAPDQLRAEDTSAVGIAHLRSYLDLAARGTAALPRTAGARDRHRDEVAAALTRRGLVVRTDVGLSGFRIDLTVARAADPDGPLLAVLLDGPAWARRRTVGDRDGLPVELLGTLGWPAVERVWLPAWLTDREEVLDRLTAAVEAAVPAAVAVPAPADVEPEPGYDGPLAEVIPLRPVVPEPIAEPERIATSAPLATDPEPIAGSAPPATDAPVVRRKAPAAPLDGELRFVAWTPKPAGEKKQLDRLSDPAVARVVRRVLAAGVKAESPVHRDRLVRVTAAAFGLSRVTEARRDALLALLPKGSTVDGEFVWAAGLDRDGWTAFRRQASSTARPLEHVSPEEIGNAIIALARSAPGASRDELQLRALEVFGYRRRTPALLPLLDAALAAAVARGRLVEQPDGSFTG